MTFVFCQRFLPAHGDRTVDQMVQAARSSKQNIVEGTEDGTTSTEMHIKLLNVARASLQELREDYLDYLISRQLPLWNATHPRYHQMQTFCKAHNRLEEYNPYLEKWNDEEMANITLTLCHMTDAMLNHHLKNLEKEFVEQGGIKERMYAARTGYRQHQDAELASLRADNTRLKADNAALQAELTRLRDLLVQYGLNI